MRKRSNFCYWTIATGGYGDLVAAMIQSARKVGVTEEFHVWTDRESIPGAICHPAGLFNNWGWLFKLVFLREEVQKLEFEHTVYLDSDTWFVKHPGNILRVLNGGPFHVSLECDLTRPHALGEWWQYPTSTFVNLCRAAGVTHESIYSVNGGMFITHRDAIETVYLHADSFWQFCKSHGVFYVDEPLIGYAMQRICREPSRHTVGSTRELWVTDVHTPDPADALNGKPFRYFGLLRQDDYVVRPALVHSVYGKQAMLDLAKLRSETIGRNRRKKSS